ncbi:MAG: TolC family protein, partial [Bacteroidetes bacterium]
HNSNYTPNYFGLGISLPLPLWNRNQGNIKSADISIKQQQTNFAQADLQLRNNVQNAFNKLLLVQKLNGQLQKDFYSKYENLLQHVLDSYKQKQIDLVDFIDFFEAYKESRTKLLQQQLNLHLAKEELNFETGVDSIK